jgi:hypothetical protein
MRRTMHRGEVQAPQAARGIEELVRELRRRVESAGPPTGEVGVLTGARTPTVGGECGATHR